MLPSPTMIASQDISTERKTRSEAQTSQKSLHNTMEKTLGDKIAELESKNKTLNNTVHDLSSDVETLKRENVHFMFIILVH